MGAGRSRPGSVLEIGDLQLFSNQLSLSVGSYAVEAGKRIVGPMRAGLKIGVILDGRQSLGLDDNPAVVIGGPALVVAANTGNHVQERIGLASGTSRFTMMQFETGFVEREFGIALEPFLVSAGLGDVGIWVRPASPTICALALQMAECPVGEPLRSLYLGGKALELAAMALAMVMNDGQRRPARLPQRTADRIRAAREILVASLQSPPALPELARIAGLNPTRLTSGFRQLYGASVFEYLQEHWLQTSYALILSGEKTVAEAAFHVGYTPAHFSSLFKKRFGIAPSALR